MRKEREWEELGGLEKGEARIRICYEEKNIFLIKRGKEKNNFFS